MTTGPVMKKRKIKARTPALGIMFLVDGRLFIASSPLAECQDFGDFKNYPGGHPHYWTKLRKLRAVPTDSEYEEYPPGRAVFDRKTRHFSLYLDRCILLKPRVVIRILSKLDLPAHTAVATDPQYRCPECLRQRHCTGHDWEARTK